MLIDYWLAGHLGRVWLWLRKGLRPAKGDLPGLCAQVARGSALPAATLLRVQDFAAMMWWRLIMAAVIIMGAVGLPAKVLSGGAVPFAPAVGFGSVIIWVMAIASAHIVVILIRSGQIRLYLRKAAAAAGLEPLPPGSAGLPRRSDFWLVMVVAAVVVAICLNGWLHTSLTEMVCGIGLQWPSRVPLLPRA